MRRCYLWACAIVLAAAPAPAQAPKLVQETWDAAYIEGAKAGHVHTKVEQLDADGKKVLRTTMALNLTVKRADKLVPLRMDVRTDETEDGKVVGVGMTQYLDGDRKAVISGTVSGGKLKMSLPGQPAPVELPWNDESIGPRKQEALFKEKKVKPGDKLTYVSYEAGLLAATTVRVEIKPREEVDVLEAKKDGDKVKAERVKTKLLRVEGQPDKVEVNGQAIPLPAMVSWLDKDFLPVRSAFDMPGMGEITLYRTTEAIAKEAGAAPALLPDLLLGTLVKLDKRIEKPLDARSIVYRVRVKGDKEPASALARDERQSVGAVKDGAFELIIKGQVAPGTGAGAVAPGEEFTESSYFLDSDDKQVKALAAKAVGDTPDPWEKARRIERWVHDNMKGTTEIGFATASQVAKDLKGDCRQHAMLAAAMCRAVGVPSRTALGLVYLEEGKERLPVLGFHMWTEVWIKGKWMGLDPTLGQGGVGVGHVKVCDTSWHKMQTLAPLLPVIRVIGKLSMEVVRIE